MTEAVMYVTSEGWLGVADWVPSHGVAIVEGPSAVLYALRYEVGDLGFVPGWTIDAAPDAKRAMRMAFTKKVRAALHEYGVGA